MFRWPMQVSPTLLDFGSPLIAETGLTADARVLIQMAQTECQSHRLTVEDPVTVDYISRYIARIQQKYTQQGGVRPFGISTLVVGHDADKSPRLYHTDPAGMFSEWKVGLFIYLCCRSSRH